MNKSSKNKLKIGYTFGDLGGVGAEIFHKFKTTRNDVEMILIDSIVGFQEEKITLGKASMYSGEHAYKTLVKADQLAKTGAIDFLITGPVAKESLWLAGIQCSGQTELLAMINGLGREQIEMFFVLGNLRFVLATRHVPLKDVPQVLEERLEAVIVNSYSAMKKVFGINDPRIAVAGLNPHAGENGILGFEEKNFIKPLVKTFQSQMQISGPYPADTLFAQAAQDWFAEKTSYDLYIAAYHDQALALIKGLGGLRAINLTYGLPYLRLSVDHGTGFDIAGKGLASSEGLEACTDYCLELASKTRINSGFIG